MGRFIYKAKDKASHKKLGQLLQELDAGEWLVKWTKNRPVRSLGANRYYHAIIHIIATETSTDPGKLHELLKAEFNTEAYVMNGEVMTYVKSTADLNTKEFADYVRRVKHWAAERLGIIIPDERDIDYAKWDKIKEDYERSRTDY